MLQKEKHFGLFFTDTVYILTRRYNHYRDACQQLRNVRGLTTWEKRRTMIRWMYVTDLRAFNYLLTRPTMEPHGTTRPVELCTNYTPYLVRTRTSLLYVSAILGL